MGERLLNGSVESGSRHRVHTYWNRVERTSASNFVMSNLSSGTALPDGLYTDMYTMSDNVMKHSEHHVAIRPI